MIVFRQKWLFLVKSGCIGAKCFYSSKIVVFGQSGFIRAMWLYSEKSCCILAEVVVFGQKWLCSGKVVVIGKELCIRTKWFYLGKSVCFPSK